jgi:hypothetical protein
MLLNEGQLHLFEHWSEPGVDDDKKKGFFKQVCVHAQNILWHYQYYIHEYIVTLYCSYYSAKLKNTFNE